MLALILLGNTLLLLRWHHIIIISLAYHYHITDTSLSIIEINLKLYSYLLTLDSYLLTHPIDTYTGMFYANIRVTLSTAALPTNGLCNARFWLGHLGFTIVPGDFTSLHYRYHASSQ